MTMIKNIAYHVVKITLVSLAIMPFMDFHKVSSAYSTICSTINNWFMAITAKMIHYQTGFPDVSHYYVPPEEFLFNFIVCVTLTITGLVVFHGLSTVAKCCLYYIQYISGRTYDAANHTVASYFNIPERFRMWLHQKPKLLDSDALNPKVIDKDVKIVLHTINPNYSQPESMRAGSVRVPVKRSKSLIGVLNAQGDFLGSALRIKDMLVMPNHVFEDAEYLTGQINHNTERFDKNSFKSLVMSDIDMSYSKLSERQWSRLGASKVSLGTPKNGPVKLDALTAEGGVSSQGRIIGKGVDQQLMKHEVIHTASSTGGSSGGALYQNGRVVGIHITGGTHNTFIDASIIKLYLNVLDDEVITEESMYRSRKESSSVWSDIMFDSNDVHEAQANKNGYENFYLNRDARFEDPAKQDRADYLARHYDETNNLSKRDLMMFIHDGREFEDASGSTKIRDFYDRYEDGENITDEDWEFHRRFKKQFESTAIPFSPVVKEDPEEIQDFGHPSSKEFSKMMEVLEKLETTLSKVVDTSSILPSEQTILNVKTQQIKDPSSKLECVKEPQGTLTKSRSSMRNSKKRLKKSSQKKNLVKSMDSMSQP